MMMRRLCMAVLVASSLSHLIEAFQSSPCVANQRPSRESPVFGAVSDDGSLAPIDNTDKPGKPSSVSRRHAISLAAASVSSLSVLLLSAQQASAAESVYRPAKRTTAYLVDSTVPPTLVPLNAQRERSILNALGKGLGTSKAAVLDDSVNLNNILNKAVFGTVDALSSIAPGAAKDDSKSGPGYASFVCFGVPKETQQVDINLVVDLFTMMIQARKSIKSETALGLTFAPLSSQPALDDYIDGSSDEPALIDAMTKADVSESTIQVYLPLLQLAKTRMMKLLACAPEMEDKKVTRLQGLQNISPERRAKYVADAQGFIALTQDARFKMYTDRSLLKDFQPSSPKDQQGNFFAERILVHETAATVLANYAMSRPDSFVAVVAPIPDLRFLEGINGRIPRVCQYLNGDSSKVTNNAVTTILLNPTAKETLSLSRYLRLEIGTSPETLDYQTKVADYLWFSSMPKVNMLPRLMNAP